MIGIDETGRGAPVTELPDDEVRADDQIVNDLPLHPEAHMYRGRAWQVAGNNGALLVCFDVGDGKVSIVRITPSLCQIRANRGKTCSTVAPVNRDGFESRAMSLERRREHR